MKIKVTDTYLKKEEYVIVSGYCELAKLLKYESPIAYTCGKFGWRYDVYKIGDVYITTGYGRPRGCGIDMPSDIKEEYEEKIADVWRDNKEAYAGVLDELRAKLKNYVSSKKREKK